MNGCNIKVQGGANDIDYIHIKIKNVTWPIVS